MIIPSSLGGPPAAIVLCPAPWEREGGVPLRTCDSSLCTAGLQALVEKLCNRAAHLPAHHANDSACGGTWPGSPGPFPPWRHTHGLDPASRNLGITWPGSGMWERLSVLTTDLLSNCPRSSTSAHSQAFQDRRQNHTMGGALIPSGCLEQSLHHGPLGCNGVWWEREISFYSIKLMTFWEFLSCDIA